VNYHDGETYRASGYGSGPVSSRLSDWAEELAAMPGRAFTLYLQVEYDGGVWDADDCREWPPNLLPPPDKAPLPRFPKRWGRKKRMKARARLMRKTGLPSRGSEPSAYG
ncbi:MAG TPA: hypothetical protein PKW90_24985, partial [Myxococcota bacterium]|nr:hypothetical protein [Myxococcota bacterium]